MPTFKRFQMPGSGLRKVWYSMEAGPVHFLQLDTELPFGAGSEQNKYAPRLRLSMGHMATAGMLCLGEHT